MRKLICTLLAAAFVTASMGTTAFAAETENTNASEITAVQAEESALVSGGYAVDISWTPMAGMISPVLDIDVENMTFNLYNAGTPETSKGSGTIACADGVYTMTYSDGNTTTLAPSSDGSYTYVDTMTFTAAEKTETYDLALYMSDYQFGGESARMLSDGSVLAATLSMDWTKAYTNVKVSSNGTVTNTGSTSASPKTGDTLPMAAGIVLLVSAGAAVCLYKKRNEE